MSSPITVGIDVVAIQAVLVAAAAIRAGHARAESLRNEHVQTSQARNKALAEAHAQGRAADEAAATEAETRLERLITLGGRLGFAESIAANRPLRPQDTDRAALDAYVRQLQSLADSIQHILLTEAGQRADAEGLGEALTAFQELPAETTQRASARLLARLAHLGDIPADLAELASELDTCSPGERAELLATELRLRIQQRLHAEQERAVQEATAIVIEQSLKDLGYEVEDISHTLYVEGGAVHFRRPGWGDHMVRMRLDFKRRSANFNVIRAVDEGNNTRSVADHLAEDRWCAEFPALMKALEVRGVLFNVTRRVEPGDLPVQLVERSRLPHFAQEEESAGKTTLRAREIP